MVDCELTDDVEDDHHADAASIGIGLLASGHGEDYRHDDVDDDSNHHERETDALKSISLGSTDYHPLWTHMEDQEGEVESWFLLLHSERHTYADCESDGIETAYREYRD